MTDLRTINLDFEAVDDRLNEFVAFFLRSSDGIASSFEALTKAAGALKSEEKLYYVFLCTHFHSPYTASNFYNNLTWRELLGARSAKILKICGTFFRRSVNIGDHRRYFRCLPPSGKISYTATILESYRQAMKSYGSQARFFETPLRPGFSVLYKRMAVIDKFEHRLPRFDHLENLSRTHNFYVVPKRFYADDNASGPLYGLLYLLFGIQYKRNKPLLRAYLQTRFAADWNSKVDRRFRVPDSPSFDGAVRVLEEWSILNVRRRLPSNHRNSPAYIFDLESCLCNWQKWK